MKISEGKFIYTASGTHGWDFNTFTTPHAMLLDEETIRIYGGARDKNGVSRITFIDVEAKEPSRIIRVNENPVLDVGEPGCFDDNGVILGDILKVDSMLYMYYVGFQHVQKVKFCAFSGLAISDDGGMNFKRVKQTPILDRSNEGRFGRCIHTVIKEDSLFKCYYAVINGWKIINGIDYPIYDIWYTESKDGINFPNVDKCKCISTMGNEYRIGRPKVYKMEDEYVMFYTRDTINKEYLAGMAKSCDGINWERLDLEFPLKKSGQGFDSEMACYPVLLECKYGTYLFYNGNGMGKEGVGYCRVE